MELASTRRDSDSQGRSDDALQSDSEDPRTPNKFREAGVVRDGNRLASFLDALKRAGLARAAKECERLAVERKRMALDRSEREVEREARREERDSRERMEPDNFKLMMETMSNAM